MNIEISDHAFIRYLERVMGLDVEAMKHEVIKPILNIMPQLPKKGTTRILHDGVCYVFQGRTLATLYPADRLSFSENNEHNKGQAPC